MGREKAAACNRELGAELRKRRKAARLSASDVAFRTGWDPSKVSRIESGHAGTSMVDLCHYLAACQVFPRQADELVELCGAADRNLGYWLCSDPARSLPTLVFHESAAKRSTYYEPVVVPGLLQTRDYARAMIANGGDSPERAVDALRVRIERQRVLGRAPRTFFVHEQALRLPVGGPALMHEQLLHILLTAATPGVTVRVVPQSAGERSVFGGPFHLIEFDRHDPLVYLDFKRNGLFLDGRHHVATYREALPELDAVALDEHRSRAVLSELADAYERPSPCGHRCRAEPA